MKISTYMSILVVALCISSCKTLKISNDEPLDRIVLIAGDTLYGKMEYFEETNRGPEPYNKVKFIDITGKKKRFKWEEIDSYRFDGSDYVSLRLTREEQSFGMFKPKEIRYYLDPYGKKWFLKIKHIGALSHYQFEWIGLGNDWMNDHGVPNYSWSTQDLLKKADDDFFMNAEGSILSGLPRKSLSKYLSDCPEIQEKIINKDFKWAFQVVDFYDENCVKLKNK